MRLTQSEGANHAITKAEIMIERQSLKPQTIMV